MTLDAICVPSLTVRTNSIKINILNEISKVPNKLIYYRSIKINFQIIKFFRERFYLKKKNIKNQVTSAVRNNFIKIKDYIVNNPLIMINNIDMNVDIIFE